MKKEEIHLNDIQRILFGQAPVEFLLEVFIRTIVVYILLLIVLRLMGKRMDGQISIIEMAVMVMMGAIVSVGMQLPDRGILMAVVAMICVLVFQRGVNWFNVKSHKVEEVTNGSMSILVKDGVLELDQMKASGISKQNLFSTLRQQQIFSLGKVKRVYFEACGLINIYKEEQEERPGLPVFPSNEEKFIRSNARIDAGSVACRNCGFVDSSNRQGEECKNCGEKEWMEAIF